MCCKNTRLNSRSADHTFAGSPLGNLGRLLPGGGWLPVGPSARRFTLVPMSLIVELSDEVLARLEAAANARGVSVEELAAETLSNVPAVDGDFASLVTSTITEHREILDSLAAT